MSEDQSFEVQITQVEDFLFTVNFGLEKVDDLIMDEPEPVGRGLGPNASRVLAASVGNCLSASLLFCLKKSRVDVKGMETKVEGIVARNEEGRWRIETLNVEIVPEVEADQRKQIERCIDLYEQFCVASQSIRQGIQINVMVNFHSE